MSQPAHQHKPPRATLAAFDFDGTLAPGDSLFAFLLRLLGTRTFVNAVANNAISLASIALGRGDRDAVKERFLGQALRGIPVEQITGASDQFVEHLLGRLRPVTVEKLRWHQGQGHQTVLVSASLDVYLAPLATRLGFDAALCTKLEIVDGFTTGRLLGGNVRGPRKAVVVQEFLSDRSIPELELSGRSIPELELSGRSIPELEATTEIWAYGDSAGDHELFAMADHPFLVHRNGTITPWR